MIFYETSFPEVSRAGKVGGRKSRVTRIIESEQQQASFTVLQAILRKKDCDEL